MNTSRQPGARDAGHTHRLASFLGISLLAGALMAALAFPVIGGMGLAAKAAANGFTNLPADLDTRPMPQRSRILDADGELLATFYDENRVEVPLTEVAPVMQRATLAIEDARFYDHGGIDIRGTFRAFIANTQSGDVRQGGSTLTQQYVKNLLIQLAEGDKDKIAAARATTIERKLRELKYALEVESRFTKDEILQNYLNIAYFGDGVYGVEAAARHFFSKPAASLTLAEAATLAGVVRSPSAYDPTRNPERALARRNVVLRRMAEVGYVSASEAASAAALPLGMRITETMNGCTRSVAPFFCDYVRRVIESDPVFGRTEEERRSLLLRGGITIRTTLDLKAQEAADKALDKFIYPKDPVAGAIAMIQPGTGEIKAIAVNREFGSGKGKTQINYAVDKKYGGGTGFQVGSTMKAFTAAAAIDERYGVHYSLSAPYRLRSVPRQKACSGGSAYDPGYAPVNEDESENFRSVTMRRATEMSLNTYFIQLQAKVGLCDVVTMAEQARAHRADGRPFRETQSFTLGVNELSPLTMANAYATFAARGVACEPIAILGAIDRTGKKLEVPKPACQEVMKPEVADVINALLQGVVRSGTGRAAALRGRQVAGKTGTINDRKAAWFVGYTPQLSTAVVAADPDVPIRSMERIRIGPRYFSRGVQGAQLPAPIWGAAMLEALRGEPAESFNKPSSYWYDGKYKPKPRFTPRPRFTIPTIPPGQIPGWPPDGNRGRDPRQTSYPTYSYPSYPSNGGGPPE